MWTMNLQMFKLDLEKAEEPEIKLLTSTRSSKKQEEFQKNMYFCLIDYAKAFDSVDHNKLWKILKEMGIPYHLTYLLRNLYAGQEATVRGTWVWANSRSWMDRRWTGKPGVLQSMGWQTTELNWSLNPIRWSNASHRENSFAESNSLWFVDCHTRWHVCITDYRMFCVYTR